MQSTAHSLKSIIDKVNKDPGLKANISQTDINGGAAGAVLMNEVIAAAIEATGVNEDGRITPEDARKISDDISSNPELLAKFIEGHGDDEGNEETGFHLVQGDGGTLKFQGRKFVDTVADAIYHIGFNYKNGRFVNEDGNANETVDDIAGWLNYFENGENVVYGTDKREVLHSGEYSDLLADAADEVFLAGAGNDDVWAGDGDDEVWAGSGNDNVGGGNGDDVLMGEGGKDKLWGQEGNDTIHGGAGHDTIGGHEGDDMLHGDAGKDKIWAGEGNDTVTAGTGNDTVGGGLGNDAIDGGDGKDKLWGEAGDDDISGGAGNDRIGGGNGDDDIDAGDGADTVYAGAGQDSVSGGAGKDLIYGHDGDDILEGGDGNDVMSEGTAKTSSRAERAAIFCAIGNPLMQGTSSYLRPVTPEPHGTAGMSLRVLMSVRTRLI